MAEPFAFASESENYIPIPVKMIDGLLCLSGCTDNPETFFGKKIQGSSQIDHLGNGQRRVGSGSSFEELACDLGGAVFGQDQTVHAEKSGCSDKGAEISFVSDVIGYDEKRATWFMA